MESTKDVVTRLVAQVTGREQSDIDDAARLAEDLRIKSANRIQLTALISDELGVELSFFDALKAKTFGDLVALVDARRSVQAS